MTFEELTNKLGVADHLPLPPGYYPVPKERENELCSLAMIDSLQEKYGIFSEYYQAVREGFLDMDNDPLRKAYLDSISLYFKDAPVEQAREIKYPQSENTPASNMLPLLAHLPSIDNTYEIFRKRGFNHEEAVSCLSIYTLYLREEEKYRSKIIGISGRISNWMSRFTKGTIFYLGDGGLNFQPIKLPDVFPTILMNKKDKRYVPIYTNNSRIHKSGVPFGSAGAKDTEGLFLTSYEETQDAFIGHCANGRTVSEKPQTFAKNEWELVLSPGDDVISVHIFWDADLSPNIVDTAFNKGIKRAIECYPEFNFKALYTCTWLISPEVNDALGENSKLSQFASRFVRFPVVSDGKSVIRHVFPNNNVNNLNDLVENTSLQRAFKAKMLAGEFIYNTRGVIPLNL